MSDPSDGPHRDRFRTRLGLGFIIAAGLGMGIVELRHIQAMSSTLGVSLFAIAPFVLDILLIVAGLSLWRSQLGGTEILRIAGWVLLGMVVIGSVALWTITHQNVRGRPFAHATFVTVNNLSAGALIGLVVGWYDVQRRRHRRTAERRQAELARQNERLDRFGGVISHDLQNPLSVASGRLELAREEHGSEHLTTARSALDRMETIIDQTLTLARAGQTVDPTSQAWLSLGDVAEESWRATETEDGELVIEDDVEIAADQERLRHVFENLFRNAVTHGGNSVTVRVGVVDGGDGLFVEDDGPGVPAAEHDQVFEAGYSTTDSGTGLGLNIVRDIVDAHGWGIGLTAGSDGGARFEITGIDIRR